MSKNTKGLEELIQWINSKDTYYSFPVSDPNTELYKQTIISHLKELYLCIERD